MEIIKLQKLIDFEFKSDTELNFTFVGRGYDILASKPDFIHKEGGIKSRINIKAVLFDESKFDIEAKLKIEKGAVNTDSYLSIRCLVVGDKAVARVVPSLEILESEVKGGHGATVGYLNPEEVHYLMSKGLSRKESEEILIDAFINS